MKRQKIKFFVLISILLLSIFDNPLRVFASDDTGLCIKNLESAAKDATYQYPPKEEKVLKIEIKSFNDFQIEDSECMANVVIYVETVSKKRFYAIFHIHFTGGRWIKTASPPEWVAIKKDGDWDYEWCRFLESVYPEEYKKRCDR